tara:strand:- start:666 stop:1481 length:816 start_codon:yes stop_codon:yes gene_type:complete
VKKFAVVGSPISHSVSPKIHAEFARSLNLELSYKAIEVNKDEFTKKLRRLFENNYDGLNVTLPLKELAYQFADEVTPRGVTAGAVNTLWKKDGKIYADTTDGLGLIEDLNNNSISIRNSSIIVVGAGGSAKSILHNLVDMRPKEITIINRTESRAESLAELFKGTTTTIRTSSLKKGLKRKINGIINTSSAGLLGDDIIVPEGLFSSAEWVYDLNYSKDPTQFISLAKQKGIKNCLDGVGMLVHQAALSFEIWTGEKPFTKNIINHIRTLL